MSATLKPLADRIVAVREEAPAKTAAGLYLPDASKQKTTLATVIAVGKDVTEVKVGDRIVYDDYKQSELKQDGKEYLIVKEEDVLAVLAK